MAHPLFVIAAAYYGGKMLYKLLNETDERFEKEFDPDQVINCHSLLTSFHAAHIKLDKDRWHELRAHGFRTHDRIVAGLKAKNDPTPCERVLQGSFGMKTVAQPHPDTAEHYDIDLGIVFRNEELLKSRGGEMSPLDVRTMVFDALGEDSRFSSSPEKKENCIRVNYSDHHVDVPSYRYADDNDDAPYELASSTWKSSSPKEVTKWFEEAVKIKSPDDDRGQLRRVVQMLKYYSKSRPSWNAPSGLIISRLVVDAFPVGGFPKRDDLALVLTLLAIYRTLQESLEVEHPVLKEYITKTDSDACMVNFRDNLEKHLENLNALTEEGISHVAAKKAWGKVFKHSFFDEETENTNDIFGSGIASMTPDSPVKRNDEGKRYG